MGKKENGAGNIRKRKDGLWEGRYSIGSDPGTGKPLRKSVYGKTQAEVRQKLTALTAAIDRGEFFEPTRITVGEWMTIWTRDYLDNIKFQTARQYRAAVETHIRPALGSIKLAELSPVIIKRFYDDLLKSGKTVYRRDDNGKAIRDKNGQCLTEKAPLSVKTLKNVHGVFTKSLSVAVDMGFIKSNPCDKLKNKLPRSEKTEAKVLTDEQISAFMSALENEEFKYLYQAILFMGLRKAEAAGLTWDCIDFDAGTVTVKQQLIKRSLADGGFMLASTKNDKTRTICPAPFVMDALKSRRVEQIRQRFSAGEAWRGFQNTKEQKTALCFTTADGSPLSPNLIYKHYKKIAERIGADNTCVHSLRHSFAVVSLQNGDDPKTVQENLGHYSAAFTLDKYGHVSQRMRTESANRMQAYIEAIG